MRERERERDTQRETERDRDREREQQGNKVLDAEDAKTFCSSVWFQETEKQEFTAWIQNWGDDIKVTNKQEHVTITVKKSRKLCKKCITGKPLD